jgi:hypothetical protein
MNETFRLHLNQAWEAIDIKTGTAVVIPEGSHKAARILHRIPCDPIEEPWLVVTIQRLGKPVSVGLREAYWRQWEGHHVPELRVKIREWKDKPLRPRQTKP